MSSITEYKCTEHKCNSLNGEKKCCYFCIAKKGSCENLCKKDPNKCGHMYISSVPRKQEVR